MANTNTDTKNVSDEEPPLEVQTQPEVATARHLTRLPQFWETHPKGWFVTAEIMFDANKITGDKQKFSHLVLSLTAQQSEMVSYILTDPPVTNKYDTLKQILIDRFSISDEQKLEQIINKVDIGDQKPSHVLHKIKTLAGKDFTSKVISKLWIRQLPKIIQTALIPQQEKPEEELAKIADKLHDMVSTRSEVVGEIKRDMRQPPSDLHMLSKNMEKMQQQINNLTATLNNQQQIFTRHQPTASPRSQSPRRRNFSPSRNYQPQKSQGISLKQSTANTIPHLTQLVLVSRTVWQLSKEMPTTMLFQTNATGTI